MFGTSLQVIALILSGLAASLVAWRESSRASRARAALVAWVRANRPAAWQALPAWSRSLGIALEERLYRGPLRNDREFARRYRGLPSRHRVLLPLFVSALCIGAVGVGTAYLGWHW